MRHLWLALVLAVISHLGCAAVALPSKQLTDAKATIRAAAALGAANYPPAQMALERAREKVDKGEDLIKDDELKDATMMLERAVVDAELALALTKRERAKVEADKAARQLEAMDRSN